MTRQQVLDSIKRDYDETYFFTGIVLSVVLVAKELLGRLYALVCSENMGLQTTIAGLHAGQACWL